MAKAGKQGSHEQEANAGKAGANPPTPLTTSSQKAGAQPQSTAAEQAPRATQRARGGGGKTKRARVGGTAIPGAKSTLPREAAPTNNPQQQQADSYNRTMRRRMDQMGTSPGQQASPGDQQRKRLEKRRRRSEERRQEVRKVAARGPSKITLGRKNLYFLIGVVVLLVAVIAIALLVHGFR